MTQQDKVDSFFEGLHKFVDAAYETAYGTLDTIMVEVDKVLDEVRKVAMEAAAEVDGNGTEVKVTPDIYTMVSDLAKNNSFWGIYDDNRKIIDEWSEKDVAYTKAKWADLPEDLKTYVKRDPDSPL